MTLRPTTALAAPRRAATSERIDVARALLLTPFGLDEGHLARALAEIRSHRVDDADLYFQYTRSEGWSLEEGIVKTGSFSIDQGVGVRAVSRERTPFAYSDDIRAASLLDAARTVRSISSQAQAGRLRVASKKIAAGRSLYPGLDPIASLDSSAKVALLEKIERRARAKDRRVVQVMAGLASGYDVVLGGRGGGARGARLEKTERRAGAKDRRVVQVMAGLASEYDVVLVARADGTLAADLRPLVRLSGTGILERPRRPAIGTTRR